jgi:hypothetical protein
MAKNKSGGKCAHMDFDPIHPELPVPNSSMEINTIIKEKSQGKIT